MSSRASIAALGLLCIATAWLLYNTLEYYEKEVDRGYQKEALTNPFHAAQRFLQRRGIPVDAFDGFEDIGDLNQYDGLFLSDSRHILSEKRLDQVLTWLNAGGHLMVAAGAANASSGLLDDQPLAISQDSNDKLLKHLGFLVYHESEMYAIDEDAQDNSDCSRDKCDEEPSLAEQLQEINDELLDQAANAEEAENLTPAEKIAKMESDIDHDELTLVPDAEFDGDMGVHFTSRNRLWHYSLNAEDEQVEHNYEAFFWRGDGYGAHFMQMDVGEGLVSIFSDASVFESDHIELFDHAYLWSMLNEYSGGIAIVYATRVPSFWQLTRRNAPELLFISAMLLLLWISRHAVRFGPVIAVQSNVRRSLAEHIYASANYLWRHKESAQLIAYAQDRVHRIAASSIEDYTTSSHSERYRMLAARCGMSQELVADCMTPGETVSQDRFLEKIQRLQKIGYML